MNTTTEKLIYYALPGLISLYLILQSSSLIAGPDTQSHSHQNIQNSAKQFLTQSINSTNYSRINIKMGSMDNRLKLAQCNTPLKNYLAPGAQLSGKTTVHVRCTGDKPWTVYLSAHIKLYTKVIKTREPLDKDHILQQSDLALVEEESTRLRNGYFTHTRSLIGKQLKRRLSQNKLIKSNYVKSPTLVKRGELVSIVAKNTGYSVKMTGTAMMSGAQGDRIRVKNKSSKRIVEGTVQQAGIVSIN